MANDKRPEWADRLLSMGEARHIEGDISPATHWRWVKAGKHPRPIAGNKIVGAELWAMMQKRIADRDASSNEAA